MKFVNSECSIIISHLLLDNLKQAIYSVINSPSAFLLFCDVLSQTVDKGVRKCSTHEKCQIPFMNSVALPIKVMLLNRKSIAALVHTHSNPWHCNN